MKSSLSGSGTGVGPVEAAGVPVGPYLADQLLRSQAALQVKMARWHRGADRDDHLRRAAGYLDRRTSTQERRHGTYIDRRRHDNDAKVVAHVRRPNGTILMGHGGTSRGRTTLRNVARLVSTFDESTAIASS